MNRSGYDDDECEDPLERGCWRAQVASAIRGKRGQAFLRELAAAMDAMPEKELFAGELIGPGGGCCTLGVVCKSRGLDVTGWNVEDAERIARNLGIAEQLVREIENENDDAVWGYHRDMPQQRWQRMRDWVESKINK